MKAISLIIIFFLSLGAAAQVKVTVEPKNPVKEESFKVVFEVTTQSDEEPRISFYPIGLEVLGRSREVSISSSFINGKFISNKKLRYNYEVVSDESRVAKLKNIEVNVGDKTLRHPDVSIKVLLKKKTPKAIFVRAELNKEQAYVGEGLDVRYFLYTRVPIVQVEFKNFPKLNGFIKRFHKVIDEESTVEENGVVYKKILKYSGRIYPEKSGRLIIDPLQLNVQYATSSGSPFGNFGLSFNRFRSKTAISKKVFLEVKNLPAEKIPPNFTGLIGEHRFNLIPPKSKYVVNEAIEAKLEVIGPGALEKLEAPKIYTSNALESFDTKSDFFEVGTSSGRKVFDYTYLARANASIPSRNFSLSYFDPKTATFKEVSFNVPELTIGGGASSVAQSPSNPTPLEKQNGTEVAKVENPLGSEDSIVAPLFTSTMNSIPSNWPIWVIRLISLILVFQVLELLLRVVFKKDASTSLDNQIKQLKREGLTYSRVVQLLYFLPSAKNGASVKDVIEKSSLSKTDKRYFLELLEELEAQNFSKDQKSSKRPRFKSSSFKSLKRVINDASY